MIQHHQWSLTELDNMIPFERVIYIEMLQQWIAEENARIERENSGKNTYQQQHLKEQQKKNIIERNKERRESSRRNTRVQKKNVLKEIQEKEDVQT